MKPPDLLILIVFWIGAGFLLRQSHSLFVDARALLKKTKRRDPETMAAVQSGLLHSLTLATLAIAAAIRMLFVLGMIQ
ncbi:MAG: hypothetical protein RLY58_2423 [Pseudomonadota bacterium]|jgi:hypothetical protein